MKQKIVLLASIGIGLLAFWMTHQYIQSELNRIYRGAEKVDVMGAARDLTAGTTLQGRDLGVISVYKSQLPGQAIPPSDVDMIIGKKILFPIRAKEVILVSQVDLPDRQRGGLSPAIRPGMRAISLAIGGNAAVSGLVQPNDRVDILGTFTMPSATAVGQMETMTFTLLQDVTVLATGSRIAKRELGMAAGAEGRMGGYSSVTFEVTPREAELLTFSEHMKGQLSLSLRHPEDNGFEAVIPEVNFDYLQKQLPEANRYRQEKVRQKGTL